MGRLRVYNLRVPHKGEAMTTSTSTDGVSFKNCRHNFGDPVSFDVVVDGVYPDRKSYVILSQGRKEIWLAIPNKSVANRVVSAVGEYQTCRHFDLSQPIEVSHCWPGADSRYQINL